jgi:uncharacterized phage protein (TIGR02218 family)
MKTLSAGHQTTAASGAHPYAWAVTITRTDATVIRRCSGTRDKTVGGNLYTAAPGFMVSSITNTAGANVVDTLDLTVLPEGAFETLDFLTGRWRGARIEFDQFNWAVPADGFIPWPVYRVADVQPKDGAFILKLRDLRVTWNQDTTLYTSKECHNRLGDSRCQVVLAPFTHAFTITSVGSARRVFTASGLAQAADYFTNGLVIFDDGAHADLELLVLDHGTGGVITLAESLVDDMVVGQTGVIIAGCIGRLEDCRDKFDNVLNMRAPGLHAPTVEESVGG